MSWGNLLAEKSALATALDLVGDRWTLMIMSGCMASVCRFNQFEDQLGINRNLLSSRLDRLIQAGILEKNLYQSNPPRYEYQLTEIGLEFRPIMAALTCWGEKHFTKEDTPISIVHKECQNKVNFIVECPACERNLEHSDLTSILNPDAGPESTRIFNERRALYRSRILY